MERIGNYPLIFKTKINDTTIVANCTLNTIKIIQAKKSTITYHYSQEIMICDIERIIGFIQ